MDWNRFCSAVCLGLFAVSVAACSGQEPPRPGLTCDGVLAGIDDLPLPAEELTRERIIRFVLENRERLEAMEPEAALTLWKCVQEE